NDIASKIEWEDRRETLQYIADRLSQMDIAADTPDSEKKQIIVDLLREHGLMFDFESFENVMLAAHRGSSENVTEAEITQLDQLLSEELRSVYVAQFSTLNRALGLAIDRKDLDVTKIDTSIVGETQRIAGRSASEFEVTSMIGQAMVGGASLGLAIAILLTEGPYNGFIQPLINMFYGEAYAHNYAFAGLFAVGIISTITHQITKRLRLRRNRIDSEAYQGTAEEIDNRAILEQDMEYLKAQQVRVQAAPDGIEYLRFLGPTCSIEMSH
ncbi:MAG: hypothetical protein AAF202_08605, partial [Pseudomonadota bacterium]